MDIRIFISMILVCFSFQVEAQIIQNQLIVKKSYSQGYKSDLIDDSILNKAVESRLISENQNLYIYTFDRAISEEEITLLKRREDINNIWYDSTIEYRTTPDDPLYDEQHALKFSQIDEVWDYTTGGTTADGKEIILAVIDDGFDINHQELNTVFWSNEEEIPNNNIDDDQNGYVDDYRGLNIQSGNDQFPGTEHGTSVSGIIGAKGNNNIGVAGINWNVKILPIKSKTAGEIIEAYNYVLQFRKKYNASNGTKGAFIGITSLSAGFSNQFVDGLFVEWCELYDLLGKEGILSFGAVANVYVDADKVGDIPTLCTSDYFISVTNLERTGKVHTDAAYGKTSVDLAAPGMVIATTNINNTYNHDFSGTSASTPMAAGVAALLMSAPCPQFADLMQDNPKEAALFLRRVLLEGVTKSDEMKNLYSSGGYLNAKRSLIRMIEMCDDNIQIPAEIGALRITEIIQYEDKVRVYFISSNEGTHFLRWSDALGRELMYKEFMPQALGERNSYIEVPLVKLGAAYLSLGNGKKTVSKGYFFRR